MIRTDYTPRRKAKVAKAYSCTRCDKVFPYNEHGKKFAEVCCTCPSCGGLSDRYMGTNHKVCSRCKSTAEWDSAVLNLKTALTVYMIVTKAQKKRDAMTEASLAEYVDDVRKEVAETKKKRGK